MGPEQVHRSREVVRIRPLNTTTKFLLMLGGVTVPVISHMAFVIQWLMVWVTWLSVYFAANRYAMAL